MHRSVSHKQRARARVEECASEPRRRLNARAVAGPGVARADTRDVRSDTQNILDTLRRSQQGTGHLGRLRPAIAGVDGDGLLTMEEILTLGLDADWVVTVRV